MPLIDDLKRHEGFRATPYKCPAGKLTIGYGLNLDAGITEYEATLLLVARCGDMRDQLARQFQFWADLSENRKDCLTNMAYNLGVPGLLKFSRMINFLRVGNYQLAAHEMLDSKWAEQVGSRATDLANMMRIG